MTRITADIRDNVVDATEAHWLANAGSEQVDQLATLEREQEERKARLRELVLTNYLSKRELGILAKVPKDWLKPRNRSVIGRTTEDGESVQPVVFPMEVLVPYKYHGGFDKITNTLPHEHELWDVRDAVDRGTEEIDSLESELRERRKAIRAQASSIVASVTTVGRLREVWPELETFYPEIAQSGTSMIPISSLNEQLGLQAAAS